MQYREHRLLPGGEIELVMDGPEGPHRRCYVPGEDVAAAPPAVAAAAAQAWTAELIAAKRAERDALGRQGDSALETARARRQAALQAEADPLFFQWQRGEATREQWLAKVQEIRTRYPDPGK